MAALAAARPALSHLDRSRTAEELSAGITQAWQGAETALRALLGGSMMSGVPLIHEARGKHMLSFEQANALAAFQGASARCLERGYSPSDADISVARVGFEQFEAALQGAAAPAHEPSPGEAMSTKGLRHSPLGEPRPVPLPKERQPYWLLALIILVIVGAAGAAAWFVFNRDGGSLESKAVSAFESGKHDVAVGLFGEVVTHEPSNARAHIYLSRLARESGDLKGAREHATLAVTAQPANPLAQREMASALLASHDYELARRFYTRVLELDATDLVAQGFLGCTLLQLGRPDEGNRWLARAGAGPWSGCTSPPPLFFQRRKP